MVPWCDVLFVAFLKFSDQSAASAMYVLTNPCSCQSSEFQSSADKKPDDTLERFASLPYATLRKGKISKNRPHSIRSSHTVRSFPNIAY